MLSSLLAAAAVAPSRELCDNLGICLSASVTHSVDTLGCQVWVGTQGALGLGSAEATLWGEGSTENN